MPPFYTGKQKLVDTGGRVERFRRRQAKFFVNRLIRRYPWGDELPGSLR